MSLAKLSLTSRCRIYGHPRVGRRARQLRSPHVRLNAASTSEPAVAEAEIVNEELGNIYGQRKNVEKVAVENIRNFSIIAHIDHGKSTIADQLLIKTGTVDERKMQKQFLDGMDLERERGITIKLNTARMRYTHNDTTYALNLIDTPGHVDFTYEVSRSLAACEGALLVVDASQGIEAQTLANVWLAVENDLEIIPVINKIDLPAADPDRVAKEIEDVLGIDASNAILCSAKTGIGIDDILEAVCERVPAPADTRGLPPRALIFDSFYDQYLGVVCQFRVMDGTISKRDTVTFMNTARSHDITDLWVLAPDRVDVDSLYAGEVGCVAGAIKTVQDARVGDTVTVRGVRAATEALPGYAEAKPQVFCGLFPTDADDYQGLREALEKLQLNDCALSFEPEVSSAMGFGFRCGFLGMLHMDIVQERLEREHNLSLIMSAPTVVYRCTTTKGETFEVSNPAALPDASVRDSIAEPFVKMEIISPSDYNGTIMDLCQSRRGVFVNMQFLTPERATLSYEMPLAEVVTDFFDELKSRSKGYASMEYQPLEYRTEDLVRLDVKINGELAEPLATICHRDAAYKVGCGLTAKLKELIPRQQFKVPIQAAIGNKVIASQSLPAMRKDVLAKCYGGDITRKKKLLAKQAEGKKRMKAIGRVNIPQEAFMAVLKVNKD